MKNQTCCIVALLCFGLFFSSCDIEDVKASGEVTTKDYNFTDFSALDICCDFKAYLTFSSTEESIQIEADDNLHEYIVVELSGNTLVIRLKDNVSVRGNETMNAYITTALIKDIEATGDSEVFLENKLNTKQAKIELSGDSKLIGEIEVLDFDVELKGDSKMEISGSTKKLEAVIKGDSKLENFMFSVDDLEIE